MSIPSEHPLFEIVRTKTGAISIRNKLVGEIMHNPVGPWLEANLLYIEQSGLKKKLLLANDRELVLFDVGLGAAANALAALACARSLGSPCRAFRIVSFEKDLELLRFALDRAEQFDHFHGYEAAIRQILDRGFWTQGQIFWELRHGDFVDLIDSEKYRADLVFYDPYSPKMNEEMWTSACFAQLRRKCRESHEGGACLYTYSLATRIRVALIKAGFFVGYGIATGLKSETTEAATGLEFLRSPVGQAWFERWQKSDVRYPYDCREADQPGIDLAVTQYISEVLLRSPAAVHTED